MIHYSPNVQFLQHQKDLKSYLALSKNKNHQLLKDFFSVAITFPITFPIASSPKISS